MTRPSQHDRQEAQAVETVFALLFGAAVFGAVVLLERLVAAALWDHPASGTNRVVGLSVAGVFALIAMAWVLIRAVRRGL